MITSRLQRGARSLRSGLLRRLPAVALGVAMLLTAVGALLHPGVPTPRVNLDDGGIWVTNRSQQLVGHLNYEARVLDANLVSGSTDFDIGQFGNHVTFADAATNVIAPVDVANVRLQGSQSLPVGSVVAQGGERIGVLDPETGSVWVVDTNSPGAAPLTAETARATGLSGGVLTTAVDGTVMAASAAPGQLVSIPPEGGDTERTALEFDPADRLTLTAVGSRPVLLIQESQTLRLPTGREVNLTDAGVAGEAVLQEPGPADDEVILATPTTLVRVNLESGVVRSIPASEEVAGPGQPAAPVTLGNCHYGAWAGTGAYLRACADGEPYRLTVPKVAAADELVFRTNRSRIVLNDITDGSVWLPDENMVLAADWEEIQNQVDASETPEDAPQVTDEIADPDRKEKNTAPIATDDHLGVRPGRATTLDVLGNDSDVDGDVLTSRPVTQPEIGTLAVSRGGQSLRLDVPAEATGTSTFSYEASDGLALDAADVTVTVVPWGENSAPRQRRDPGLKLGAMAQTEANILPHFLDPDGDPIYLKSVTAPTGLQVQFREEGTVTIKDLGHDPGPGALTVTVSDGRTSVEGQVTVAVQEAGNVSPVANGDFAVGRVGEPLVVQPLANDTDPNGDALTLLGTSPPPTGAVVVPDTNVGTLTVTARAPGSYSLTYAVTDGPTRVNGVIRVDVVADDVSAIPVAEDDLVLLPPGGEALAEPLGNDSDPAGGVLVLQSVQLARGSPLQVTVVDHHLLRIIAPGGLDGPETVTYTISNGAHTAKGRILVVGMQDAPTTNPPEVQPDHGRVRVGDVGSVAVLGNDRSPAGLSMQVEPRLEYSADPAIGTPFVTRNQVRLQAGDQPGFLQVAYTVRDTEGAMATGMVTFEVVADDGANADPRPRPLTAWAVSGQPVRIPISTAGIDPDGDSVVLAGVGQPPTKGTAELGTDWIEYTPAAKAVGTDVFTYLVEDRLGRQSTARVRVGIAPPSAVNEPPTAVPDTVLVRPGRTLLLAVLANDLDADGDALTVTTVESPEDGLNPTVVAEGIRVTTPRQAGAYVFTYTLSDGRGGRDVGTVTLNVLADVPLAAPAARDDVVAQEDVPTDGAAVEIDVLANDADADGELASLVLASEAAGVRVAGGKLIVTPERSRRLVVYTVTDADGLTGSAVVSVPGTERERPYVDRDQVPVEVRAGQETILDLRSLVRVREGRSPRITDPASVRVSVGSEDAPEAVDEYTIRFRADPDYAGPVSVSVVVSDGAAEDRSALSAALTLPIRVVSAVNHPPTVTPTLIKVGAGEGPVTHDLRLLVDDPDGVDPATFGYALGSTPSTLSVELSGSILTVSAGLDHPKGGTDSIGIAVDDGSGAVKAEIPVEVVASSKPLIQVSDAVLNATAVGTVEEVDLEKFTINPFPDHPVRIVGTMLLTGDAQVDPRDTTLRIIPRELGMVTLVYRLMDATADPDRMVEGRVRLVVRDRPDPPTEVAVIPTGPGEALVTFKPGADNGAPIEFFTVSSVSGGGQVRCSVASCRVTGLTNGRKHAFRVVARNAVGDSSPSEASPAVLVDVSPGRPKAPTGTVGDGTITLTWEPPTNAGSTITGYTVYLTGDEARELTVDGQETTATFTGLSNGKTYVGAIQAHNRSEQPSESSETSADLIPRGTPPSPPSVSATNVPPDSAAQAKLEIAWEYPESSNGRPFNSARVTWGDQTRVVDSDGAVTSVRIDVVPDASVDYSVALHTEAGWSEETSGTVAAVSIPVELNPPTVRPTGETGELEISDVAPVDGNGYLASQLSIERSVAGGPWEPHVGTLLTGLQNGTPYAISFRQVAEDGEFPATGPEVTVASATPYGPPVAPTLQATSQSGGVLYAWTYAAENGGPAVASFTLEINGTKVDRTGVETGEYRQTGKPGNRFVARAIACDTEGRCASSASVTAAPWGSIRLQPAACGSSPLLPPAEPDQACATFTLQADHWNTTQLNCSFVSDVDGVARAFAVTDFGRRTATGMRTQVTKKADLAAFVGASLTCRPAT
ncbi:MAG: Ig-like domain-containing protein [Propioniciclava sp.]